MQLPGSYAEKAKQEFPKFLSMVKERRENIIQFDVTAEYYIRLDTFYCKFFEGTTLLHENFCGFIFS